MRLVGYIKEQKSNSFAIPVYSKDGIDFFVHNIDSSYNITNFKGVQLQTINFKKLYLSKNFDLGSKGGVVFIGKNRYLKYDDAKSAIKEIINYINECHTLDPAKTLLKEAILIQKKVFKEVKTEIKKVELKAQPIFLAFDLPLLKKEIDLHENKTGFSLEEKQDKTSSEKKLEQISDPAFKNEIKHLNTLEKNFEIMLKMRSNERRSNLKTYNYQFHFRPKAKLD